MTYHSAIPTRLLRLHPFRRAAPGSRGELPASIAPGAILLAVCLPATVPALAQHGEGWTAFPTADEHDGRFLSLVDDPSGLRDQRLSVELAVPAGRERLRLAIFDGDTGAPCAPAADPACALPQLGHWDRGSTPLLIRLYADPRRIGSEAEGDLLGVWRSDGAAFAGGSTERSAAPAMPDHGWWRLEVEIGPGARDDAGLAVYHLVVELARPGDGVTVSNFKLAADAPFAIRSGFGLEAGANAAPNDFAILYPGYRFGEPFDFVSAETTYDGRFSFWVDVPRRLTTLTLYDGDLDHGASSELSTPSGVPLGPCADSDDPDSEGLPPEAGPEAVPEGAAGAGLPGDDTRFDALRRSPCTRFRLIDPAGAVYRNDNPSGHLEWERFTVTSDRRAGRAEADYAPRVAADGVSYVRGDLPTGRWRLEIEGLDLGNSHFWRLEQRVCAVSNGRPACPPRGGGCTPGYWKQRHHYDAWPAAIRPGDRFSSRFDDAFPGRTLAEVLRQGGGGLNALGRHAVAALLNAASPQLGYELAPARVVALFDTAFPAGRRRYEELKDRFERLNERRCPLD